MTGLLLLDKPAGITSFAAVAKVRRLVGEKKAGHTGTLDPLATGVLPILFGGATRLANYMPDGDKEYITRLRLGIATDTLDITGKLLAEKPVQTGRAAVLSALSAFRGQIEQIPPMYSALSQNGVRLYELARMGKTVERPARQVEIYDLTLLDAAPDLPLHEYDLRVRCSAGTYIRSLVDDLGRALGCGAVVVTLRRTVAHGFTLAQCVTLEELEASGADCLRPVAEILHTLPVAVVTDAQAKRFCNGGALDFERLPACTGIAEESPAQVQTAAGNLLGIGKARAAQLCPVVVVGDCSEC
ncbi:MAG: tRNA pseudouridine(55) synthase TruB [Oscillospiraceae bacterium]|jgi:tRNA pseudouridine55 synthase|nr:tRNA pseudouridine(55) synthase TruB [Oscillospiraceae bacterium]